MEISFGEKGGRKDMVVAKFLLSLFFDIESARHSSALYCGETSISGALNNHPMSRNKNHLNCLGNQFQGLTHIISRAIVDLMYGLL